MTTLLAVTSHDVTGPPDARSARARPSAYDVVHAVSLLVALLVWDRVVLPAAGGRDAGVVVWGLLSTVPAVLLGRPWQLRVRVLLLASAVPITSFVVCLVAPTGWAGVDRPVTVTYAALAFVAVVGFATSPARRLAIVLAVCLVSLDEFGQSWLAWWGGEDPSRRMVGTFYWHNQLAAFLLPGVILGVAIAVLGERRWRKVGLITAPVCVSGMIFSASRASLMAAAIGIVLVLVQALRGADRWHRVRRWLVTVALSIATPVLLSGPPFFGSSWNPLSALLRREAEQGLSGNANARLQFWIAGWQAFTERPVTGTGFSGYAGVSLWHLPGSGLSIDPHNDLVRAFVEGGVIAGVPELVLLSTIVVLAVRRLARTHAGSTEEAVLVGSALAVIAAIAHALVDFDWQYPALAVQFGVVAAALVVARPRCTPRAAIGSLDGVKHRSMIRDALAPAVVVVVLGALTIPAMTGALAADSADRTTAEVTRLATAGDVNAADRLLAEAAAAPMADPWLSVRRLVGGSTAHLLSDADVERLLVVTEPLARVDPDARMQRDAALVAQGRTAEGLADARALASRDLVRGAPYVVWYAELLARSGAPERAAGVLVKELLVLRAHDRDLSSPVVVDIVATLRRVGAPDRLGSCAGQLALDRGWTGPLPVECQYLAGEDVV